REGDRGHPQAGHRRRRERPLRARGARRRGGRAGGPGSAGGDRAPAHRGEGGASPVRGGADRGTRGRDPEARDHRRRSAPAHRRRRQSSEAGFTMSARAFSRPYARAFVEAAPKGYDFAAFLEAGETMARALEDNPKLRAFLLAPNVPRDAKNKAIRQIGTKAGMNEYGTGFLLVMLRHHRLLEAGEVFRALRDLIDAVQGVLRVRVTVAGPLSEAEKQAIQSALAART